MQYTTDNNIYHLAPKTPPYPIIHHHTPPECVAHGCDTPCIATIGACAAATAAIFAFDPNVTRTDVPLPRIVSCQPKQMEQFFFWRPLQILTDLFPDKQVAIICAKTIHHQPPPYTTKHHQATHTVFIQAHNSYTTICYKPPNTSRLHTPSSSKHTTHTPPYAIQHQTPPGYTHRLHPSSQRLIKLRFLQLWVSW